ncbi:DUF2897 family protein [Opacimonas viscosa]|uniref:DUF2897 family protein n=1 Tax=Opacimonas viscosa TaxID=2961944 RepID=A0AA42BNP4_9ALTE|nr:DUF2897 family protein [Opacimonas viscosa]MCP3427631.1 DUF2897 family protein [Opacimonas viscosa]
MGIGWVILIIIGVLAVIFSNVLLLKDSKSFQLPDSYKERKAAEKAHLEAQGLDPKTQRKEKNKEDDSSGFY